MTIPAAAGSASNTPAADTLPFQTPTGPDPLSRISAGLAADVSPKAFKLLASIVLNLPVGRLFSIDDMASVSSFSGYQCRPLAAELVNAGLLVRRRTVVRRDGAVKDGYRYFLAVTA